MTVTFRTKKRRTQFEKHAEAEKAYGGQAARKYIERIKIIHAAYSLEELAAPSPLRCHPLKGDRAGQHAITLTGFTRLISTVEGSAPECICTIEEVSKHYDD